WIGGAPNRPFASTFHPSRRSTAPRADARQTKLATVAPVTKPTDAPRGRSSRSSSHCAAPFSAAAAAGDASWVPAFCPQVAGRDTDRMRRADHPAEEAWPGHGAEARRTASREFVDHVLCRRTMFRRRSIECRTHCRVGQRCRRLADVLPVVGGKPGGTRKSCL